MAANAWGVCCRKVTHCIFDVDGTLLDTEPIYTEAIQSILNEFGKTYTWDVKKTLMGLSDEKTAERIVEVYNLPIRPEEYLKRFVEATEALMSHVELLPGVQRLICHLHMHNIPMAIATGSSEKVFNIKINDHRNLFKFFHHSVCGSDSEVKHGKPAPDIFQVAASRFKEKPCQTNCLVFEDSPNGMKAACAAGMLVVMIPDEHLPKQDFWMATKLLNSLLDFKPEEFGLPPFPKSQC